MKMVIMMEIIINLEQKMKMAMEVMNLEQEMSIKENKIMVMKKERMMAKRNQKSRTRPVAQTQMEKWEVEENQEELLVRMENFLK